MKVLIGVTHEDKKWRVETEKKSSILCVVRVTHLKSEVSGVLTCLPKQDSVERAISRLQSGITHTKDPLAGTGKDDKPRVASYKKPVRKKK